MKLKLEIRDMRPILVTEDGEIVENVEVTDIRPRIETTKEGHVRSLIVEIKIFDQHEVKTVWRVGEQSGE